MKRIRILAGLAGAAAALLLAGCKAAEEIKDVPTPRPAAQQVIVTQNTPPPERVMEVIGTGEYLAAPDFATMMLGVSTSGETAEAASLACQEQAQKIYEVAATLSIAKEDVTQRGIELLPIQKEGSSDITGYQASDTITVIVRRMSQLDSIRAATVDAGAFESLGTTYSLTEASEAYRKALSAATGDAYAKASVLAEATGVRLGDVLSIREMTYDGSEITGVAFESSAIAVTAQVTVRYKIG